MEKDTVILPKIDGGKHINLTKFWQGKVILGDYAVGSDSSRFSLKYNGVKYAFREYNYVDGFWLGNKFDLYYKIDDKTNLTANPYIYYITGRNRIIGGTDIIYNYNQKRKGQLVLSLGSRSEDFSIKKSFHHGKPITQNIKS